MPLQSPFPLPCTSGAAKHGPVIHVCTIVARNYLAFARVLAASLRALHPDSELTVLVVDPAPENVTPEVEPFRVMNLAEIGLSPAEWQIMATIYDVMEFSTALKPWLMRKLLAEGAPAVIYFDPDIEVFARLDHIADLVSGKAILLTPHCLDPIPRDGLLPDESVILNAGLYNLGFIAVAPRAGRFLDWWAERLRRECLVDLEQSRFVDQRWVDLIPSSFEWHILRDRTCNVAYWNLQERTLSHEGERWLVNGEPLTFFHFSGFNPAHPHALSKYLGPQPRHLLSELPAVRELCDGYRSRLLNVGFREARSTPYGFAATTSGRKITRSMRRRFLQEVLQAEAAGTPLPTSPFAPEGASAFEAWLQEPACALGSHQVTREVWARFHEWKRKPAVARQRDAFLVKKFLQEQKPSGSRSGRQRTIDAAPPRQPGLQIAGYLNAELGLGEAGRLLLTAAKASKIPCRTLVYSQTRSRQSEVMPLTPDPGAALDVNVICVTARSMARFRREMGESCFAGAYNIGLWLWEVDEVPDDMQAAFGLVDEVWAPSEFVRGTFAPLTRKPVHYFPMPITAPEVPPASDRTAFGLPHERFVFLFMFDFFSVCERKNPVGLIEAFRRAFAPGEGPLLVIKSINGEHHRLDRERVREAARWHPDVRLMEHSLTAQERLGLVAASDCYVSLHRAEGYGLTMAEAMALGKPVIATAYSGNLDFMNPENSFFCPFHLTRVGKGNAPYPAEAQWAEPDIEAAARLMRQVCEQPQSAAEMGGRAQRDVTNRFSVERSAEFIRERFGAIQAERRQPVGRALRSLRRMLKIR